MLTIAGMEGQKGFNACIQRVSNPQEEHQQVSRISPNYSLSSTTYWLPILEWYYQWDTTNTQWDLIDSSRYFYHSSPPVLNGLENYRLYYNLSNAPLYTKDTFEYNTSTGLRTLHKRIDKSSTSFTISSALSTRYNISNLEKGNTYYSQQWDFANCMGGGMGYKLVPFYRDTVIYNAANYEIVRMGYNYNLSSCNWSNSSIDSIIRDNANNLPKSYRYYSFSAGQWNPSYREDYVHDANDNLISVYTFSYGTSWDTTAKYDSISFFYYDKFDIFNSDVQSLYVHQYDNLTSTFVLFGKYLRVKNSYGDISREIQLSWNGSSFDTVYSYKLDHYYTSGKKDSLIISIKNSHTGPYIPSDKYVYPQSIIVTSVFDIASNKEVLKLYPNPAQDYLYLNMLNTNEDKITEVFLYNIEGKLIEKKQIMKTPIYCLEVSHLEKGIYMLNIKTESGRVYHSKFIKN